MLRRMLVTVLAAGLVAGAGGLATAPGAAAEPATPVKYPGAGVSTRFAGKAFDTCTAPSLEQMDAWLDSPYRAVGVYIGGSGLATACQAQPNLDALWVQQVTSMGWKIIPIYVGRQVPCYAGNKPKISVSKGVSQGTSAGADAIAQLKRLGLLAGSPVYLDIEHYAKTSADCRLAMRRYVHGFTKALHAKGYLAGVYANLSSGAKDLSASYTSSKYARPDLLWVARWDKKTSLTGWAGVSGQHWATHQRMKQYRGDHDETYGGVKLNIDSNSLDTAVATVSRAYVTQNGTTQLRTGFSTKTTGKGTIAAGTPVAVVCQSQGRTHQGTAVWDRLSDGTWINDHFVSTSGATGFTKGVPRCYFPYQVSAGNYLTKRTTPKSSGKSKGTLRPGALAWVVCQTSGSKVGDTKVWDKLPGSVYVTDRYVSNSSNKTYSKPVPRCA